MKGKGWWILIGLAGIAANGESAAQELDSLISPGPLSRAHAGLAGLSNCTSCHAPGKGVTDGKCLSCHSDLEARVVADRGFHRGKIHCVSCHTDHQGGGFELIRWDPDDFDHRETGYALEGLHLRVASCGACHRPPNAPAREKSASFLLDDQRCIACHEDVHRGGLGASCTDCHSLDLPFRESRFDHDRARFRLAGSHGKVQCETCHPNQKWKGLRFARCADCHQDPHRPSLGADCQRCHSETSWRKTKLDHGATRFPLLGKHEGLACSRCHTGEGFRGVAFGQCADCHTKDPHFGQFEDDCARCHVVESFDGVSFDHANSGYPLTGRHEAVACSECHRTEAGSLFPDGRATAVRYRPLQTACKSCHLDVHYGQLATNCESCHATDGFHSKNLRFAHDRDSRFSLRGRHAQVLCADCHRSERESFPDGPGVAVRYKPIRDLCSACHENVHDESTWKASKASPATRCESCHTEESFELRQFDHARASLTLTGAHSSLECDRCHDYAVLPQRRYLLFRGESRRDCADCHRSPHLKGLERCVDCHSTTNWVVGVWKRQAPDQGGAP